MLRWLVAALMTGSAPVAAQSEAALRDYFEGQTVVPKLSMPGTDDGIDVYPGTARPLDYSRYAGRLKQYGTAIKAGEPVTVTKIKVKSKHIEFQLGGGGYGTFGDETSPTVSTAASPKTKREKNLEAELKRETDPVRKREMKEELDDLKTAREREDARNRSAVADAEEQKEQNIRQRRLEGGSRFNIRYEAGVPADALKPESVIAALTQYVDFKQVQPEHATTAPTSTRGTVRKGMLIGEVDASLGAPLSSAERKEGSLRVMQRKYSAPMGQVTADFVEGVLVRYVVTSE